jgi:hypothetical protein
MKLIVPICLGVLITSAGAFAQATTDPIQKALLAAPSYLKKNIITVIKWKPDFTYDTLQKGSGSMVCYDLSGFPGHMAFDVSCTVLGNLERVAQNLKFEAKGDKTVAEAALKAAEKDGTRVKPVFGSEFIHIAGKDQEHTYKHITIAVPNATAQSLGISDKSSDDTIWLMEAGTSTAHLMIPGI